VRSVAVVAVWALGSLAACGRSKPPADAAQQTADVAAPAARFPAGITEVRFGLVARARDAGGGQTCGIPQPLPEPPTFPAGTRELAFTARLDPEVVRQADASIAGPGVPEVRGINCNAYAVSAGQPVQTQMGSSFVRSDGSPWPAGEYTLSIRVNGANTTIPFHVE
jgi:hypothetical protein